MHDEAELRRIPADLTCDAVGKIAVSDFMTRGFDRVARRLVPKPTGTGSSGLVSIGHPGQEVLERTSVLIGADLVEARIDVGLPARGRRVQGRQATVSILTPIRIREGGA